TPRRSGNNQVTVLALVGRSELTRDAVQTLRCCPLACQPEDRTPCVRDGSAFFPRPSREKSVKYAFSAPMAEVEVERVEEHGLGEARGPPGERSPYESRFSSKFADILQVEIR